VDGKLYWIWDAYTTTNQYPYSQPVDLGDVTSGPVKEGSPRLDGSANYIRNSVKVVVDAYNGSMKYYVTDPNDPIIQVWMKAFPELFTTEIPPQLREHYRYPENLFQVQAERYTSYHVTDANVFYGKQDFWALPTDPTIQGSETTTFLMRPYYVLMKLPGETDESFVLILPFTPQDRQNMVAWMAAKSDPNDYGDIVTFEFPAGSNVDGPTQVFARINQDSRFSAERTLLGQGGSEIRFGDFLVIPIENSLLYVQPVYVESQQANAIPELKRVVVVNGSAIGIGSTLRDALSDSLGQALPPDGGGEQPPPTGGTTDEQVAALLQQAANHFAAADAALKAGNLATYQSEIEAAQAAIQQAQQLLSQGGGTPSPSPGAVTGATGASGATGATA
jgi:uncharacterized membrane protein (UPF0182 family)